MAVYACALLASGLILDRFLDAVTLMLLDILGVLLILLYSAVTGIYLPQKKLQMLMAANGGVVEPVHIAFYSDAFAIWENETVCNYRYDQVKKLRTSRRIFLLYMKDGVRIAVPRDAFPDDKGKACIAWLRKALHSAGRAAAPEGQAACENTAFSNGTNQHAAVGAQDAVSEREPAVLDLQKKPKHGLRKILLIAWVGMSSLLAMLLIWLMLSSVVDFYRGKALIKAGDYESAWHEMDDASNFISSAAAYREYCAGMQWYEAGDYEMAQEAFSCAEGVLNTQEMVAACTAKRAEVTDTSAAWELAGGPDSAPENRLWIKPENPTSDAGGMQYHDYLFIAEPGSTIRMENATVELETGSCVMPESGEAVLRISDGAYFPNRPLTEKYMVAEPRFSVTRPDGRSYAVLCDPLILRFPELEITVSSLPQYWALKAGDTIRLEGKVNSDFAAVEVNETAVPVLEGGAFTYDITLTEADLEGMPDGQSSLSFAITAQQDNHVSAETHVDIETVGAGRSAQGEGWRYADGALHISSNQGLDNFYEISNAPTEFSRIIFEEGVTTIDLLGEGKYGPGFYSRDITVEEVSIPGTAIHIRSPHDWSFGAGFQKILLSADNPAYYKENGMLIEKRTRTVVFADHDLEEAIVPENVRAIGAGAFYHHDRLKKAILPEDLRVIGQWAFYDCDNLAQINLPNSLTAIFDGAFCYTQLRTLAFPPKVQFYLLEVSESEGAVNASLLDLEGQLHTIIFTDSATFNDDAICMHTWPKNGSGRLILIGPPPDFDIVKYLIFIDNENKYAICYLSAYAEEWKALAGVYEDGRKTIRQLSATEEAAVLALCTDAMTEQPGETATADDLGWRFEYGFSPADERDEDWPDNVLERAFHIETDAGMQNFQDGQSLGYAPLYWRISLVLEDGVTAFEPDANANQPVNDLHRLSISKTVSYIAPRSFSADSVEVAADSPHYHMEGDALIETATGKVIWEKPKA